MKHYLNKKMKKKKTATLYLRVSANKQSDSLHNQKKFLMNYCELKNIKVASIVTEGRSAKKLTDHNGI
jgi:predicted site-specific integrase-resolvase